MPYVAKDFGALVGMDGFSETLLKNHFTLYQGYVANTNKLSDLLGGMLAEGKTATPEYAELKRRFGWEWNRMRLHELYFGNLGGKGALEPASKLGKAVAAEFGSVEKWEADFRAAGAMRGIGWVVLFQDKEGGRLFNQWVNEHDVGNPAGAVPVLVMDVFEHAFMVDYGLKRADYIAAFFRNVNWKAAEARI
ncbi:MAG: superoxide dismutase [Deltaproteobacteria bacterium]|nr:superoxide dismutase [Deltaproteobacteria bacterium]